MGRAVVVGADGVEGPAREDPARGLAERVQVVSGVAMAASAAVMAAVAGAMDRAVAEVAVGGMRRRPSGPVSVSSSS